MKLLSYLLLFFSFLLSPTLADDNKCHKDTAVCVAVRSVVNDTDHDFYIRLQGRVENGWAAIGLGSVMDGALFFIAYPAKDDNKTTLSVRKTSGNSAPSIFSSSDKDKLVVETLESSRNSTHFEVGFVCRACQKWKGSDVNPNSRKQSFIRAIGGDKQKISSNSDDAKITQHPEGGYGGFEIDMQNALSKEQGVPNIDGSRTIEDGTLPAPRWVIKLHALLLGGSFLAIFPAGVLALRSNLRLAVKVHWFIQSTAALFCMIGMVLGILISTRNPRFHDFNYAHQILGFILVGWVFIQLSAGFTHHIMFKKTGKTTFIAKPHVWSGRVLLPLGLINGGLGLLLASNKLGAVSYYVLGFIGLGSIGFLVFRWQQAKKEERMAGMYPGNYNRNYSNNTPFGGPGGVPLSQQPVGQGSGQGGQGGPYQYGHAQQASQSSVWSQRPPQYHEAI